MGRYRDFEDWLASYYWPTRRMGVTFTVGLGAVVITLLILGVVLPSVGLVMAGLLWAPLAVLWARMLRRHLRADPWEQDRRMGRYVGPELTPVDYRFQSSHVEYQGPARMRIRRLPAWRDPSLRPRRQPPARRHFRTGDDDSAQEQPRRPKSSRRLD